MSRKRLGRVQRVATIVPLALLSAAWTASVAGIGGPTAPAAMTADPGSLEDGTSIPDDAIDEPASFSNPGSVEGMRKRNDAGIITAARTTQVPQSALLAYQRAESVINSADKSCNLTWELLAAIGRIESDHGRTGDNVLNDDGVAEPGIYGPALNGKKKTQAIPDTDGGQFDKDKRWDRAVGPMQFIPSTWSVVGVDADGDGRRNPQDIDDAALASAVYLCSGKDDLSTMAGKRSAVLRYNNSDDYVDLVLKVADVYLDADYAAPGSTIAAGKIVPDVPTYIPPKPSTDLKPSDKSGNAGNQGPKVADKPAASSKPKNDTPAAPKPSAKPSQDAGDKTGTDKPSSPSTPSSTSTPDAGERIRNALDIAAARAECRFKYPALTRLSPFWEKQQACLAEVE